MHPNSSQCYPAVVEAGFFEICSTSQASVVFTGFFSLATRAVDFSLQVIDGARSTLTLYFFSGLCVLVCVQL